MVIVPFVIRDLIASIDYSTPITSTVSAGVDCVITVEHMVYARVGLIGYVDGSPFTIKAVDYENCTVTLADCPVDSYSGFRMDKPFYFYGTPYKVSDELSKIPNDTSKVPLIWLVEVTREQFGGLESAISTTPSLSLAFLDRNNYADWTTEQHYNNVILPMRSLLDLFMSAAVNEEITPFGDVTSIAPRVENHVNFGVFQTNKGHLNSLLNEHLSGCTLSGDFPIKKCCKCK